MGPRSMVMGALALLVGAHLAACGGSTKRETVASVGAVSISRAELDHWTGISEHALHRPPEDARVHALDYLILSAWIRAAAQRSGISVSPGAVSQSLQDRWEAMAGGREAFESARSRSHETLADTRRQIETELLYRSLERNATANVSVPQTAAAAYYRRHRRRFLIPERRFFLSDSQTNVARLARDRAHILAGGSFPKGALRESLSKSQIDNGGSRRRRLVHAIFSTPPGKLIGPFHNEPIEFYTLVEVTSVVPARYQSFTRVKGQIERELKAAAAQRALQSFRRTWQAGWRTVTHCRRVESAPACARSGAAAYAPLSLSL